MVISVFVETKGDPLTSEQEKVIENMMSPDFSPLFFPVKDKPEVVVWNNGLAPRHPNGASLSLCFEAGHLCFIEPLASLMTFSKKGSPSKRIWFPEVEGDILKKRLEDLLETRGEN